NHHHKRSCDSRDRSNLGHSSPSPGQRRRRRQPGPLLPKRPARLQAPTSRYPPLREVRWQVSSYRPPCCHSGENALRAAPVPEISGSFVPGLGGRRAQTENRSSFCDHLLCHRRTLVSADLFELVAASLSVSANPLPQKSRTVYAGGTRKVAKRRLCALPKRFAPHACLVTARIYG